MEELEFSQDEMVRIPGDPLPLTVAHVPEDSPELGGDENIQEVPRLCSGTLLQVHQGAMPKSSGKYFSICPSV